MTDGCVLMLSLILIYMSCTYIIVKRETANVKWKTCIPRCLVALLPCLMFLIIAPLFIIESYKNLFLIHVSKPILRF